MLFQRNTIAALGVIMHNGKVELETLTPYLLISTSVTMGDSGEGLVDADARIQEQMEEREAERRRRASGAPAPDPEKVRALESLRLARSELSRQSEATTHPVRRQQIQAALAEIDKRLASL
jgi:hypothetical protein